MAIFQIQIIPLAAAGHFKCTQRETPWISWTVPPPLCLKRPVWKQVNAQVRFEFSQSLPLPDAGLMYRPTAMLGGGCQMKAFCLSQMIQTLQGLFIAGKCRILKKGKARLATATHDFQYWLKNPLVQLYATLQGFCHTLRSYHGWFIGGRDKFLVPLPGFVGSKNTLYPAAAGWHIRGGGII